MTGYEAYKFYLSIKLHFTTEKYDVFENGSKISWLSEEKYASRSGKNRFESIARQVKEPQQAVQFFVANQAYDGDIFDPQGSYDNWLNWRKHKEMTTYLISEDLEQIGNLDEALCGFPCSLIKAVSGRRVNIETAVAINRRIPFTKVWSKHNFAYPQLWLKIEKLDRFVKFNESKIFAKIDEHTNSSR